MAELRPTIYASPRTIAAGFELKADAYIPEGLLVLHFKDYMFLIDPKNGYAKDLGEVKDFMRGLKDG